MASIRRCFAGIARGTAVVVAVLALAGSTALAQTPAASGHPARLHQGTCNALGPVDAELTAVGAAVGPDGTPVAAEVVGPATALPVELSATTVDTALSEVVDGRHAIAVYDRTGTRVVACGDVGGTLTMQMAGMVMPGDELAVGLAEEHDSGYFGLALLTAEGLEATIRIYLVEQQATTHPATPAAG